MKKIEIRCKGADTAPLSALVNFQGELKTVTRENIEKLKALIMKKGFIAPIFIWLHNGIKKIIDGHQRLIALSELQAEGYIIPDLPIDYIEAETEQEAREILLAITSQFGDFNKDELKLWFDTIDQETRELLRLVDEDLSIDDELEKQEIYTKKIIPPVYKPRNKKPKVIDLYNDIKTKQLLEEIENSGLSANEKHFLRIAAYRHIVFNYDKIADYYSHSQKETQELMENSALVIIDFKKAIEGGFLRLTEQMRKQYGDEFESEQ